MKYLFPLLLFILLPGMMLANSYDYSLTWESTHSRTYRVNLLTEGEDALFTDFKVPAWRPGRYILQDFAGAVFDFSAMTSSGKALSYQKINKDTWRVSHAGAETLSISYSYYASNSDAGSSYLGEGQAYFNPVNLFMYIPGRLEDPVTLSIPSLPEEWKVATALTSGDSYNQFKADSYHEFADSPTIFADEMKTLSFTDQGVKFFIHFQGNYLGDRKVDEAIVSNVKKICQTQVKIFGSYPFPYYHFIFKLFPYTTGHAVEHSRSAMFLRHENATASVEATNSMNGVIAHEFWHAWNVKRIRPAAMWPYDYSTPPYTTLQWFTEGVTDYYADLTLVRAGLISQENFLREMGRNITNIENSYAAQKISPSMSSFDSWLATSSYQNPYLQTSYYSLGTRIGMVFDLSLRSVSGGKVGLDDVFQYLYLNYYQKNQGVPEEGIQKAAEALTGKSWEDFFDRHIHGTDPVDYEAIFAPVGLSLTVSNEESSGIKRLGLLNVSPTADGHLRINALHPGGDAYRDGLTLGDILLEIDGQGASTLDLDHYVNEKKKGDQISFRIYRDYRIVEVSVRMKEDYLPKKYSLESASRQSKNTGERLEEWIGKGQ